MARNGLYISPTEFAEFPKSNVSIENLFKEVATRQRHGDFYGLTQFLPNPDPVLRKQGKDIAAYRDLMSDAHIGGCIDTRKGNVLAMEHRINPGKAKTGRYLQMTKELSAMIDSLDVRAITEKILDAVVYGIQPMELLYMRSRNLVTLYDIVDRPQEYFFFDTDGNQRFRSLQYPLDGEIVTRDKIIILQHKPTHSNPYGFAVVSRAFWPVFFKKTGFKFMVRFLEKHGTPWTSAKYPDGWVGHQDKIDDFYDKVESMVQDALIVLPQAASVEMISANSADSADLYRMFAELMNAEISKAVFGHGAAADSTPGKLGNEQTAISSVDAVKASDCSLVVSFWNEVLANLTRINYGEGAVAPKFELYEEKDVDQALATRDLTLYGLGLRPTSQYIMKKYPEFEEGDFTLEHESGADGDTEEPTVEPDLTSAGEQSAGSVGPDEDDADFAENERRTPDQIAVDERLDALTPEVLGEIAKKYIGPIVAEVQKFSSADEALKNLTTMYSEIDSDDIRKQIAKDLFNAALAGALAVDNEEAGDE